MKRILYAVALLCLSGTAAMAQQLPQFSHYGFNGMYVSPGYAGVSKQTEFNFLGRYQWAGYDASFDDGGSPQTGIISASIPWQSANSGIGVAVVYDKVASTDMQNFQLSYSYHVSLGGGTLGIGLQGGANRISKGNIDYRFIDLQDTRIPTNSADTKFDAGAGLWYQADSWYIGAGIQNLLGAEYEFESTTEGTSTVTGEKHIMATAGYIIETGGSAVITPTAIVKTDFEQTSFEIGARAEFNEKFYGGLGYRHEEAITAMVGVNLMQNNAMRVGYAFDLTAFNRDAKSLTSHEIMLSYRLPKVRAFRPAVRTPRYSF